eukprot:2290567-Prymnesium_polylepis.2
MAHALPSMARTLPNMARALPNLAHALPNLARACSLKTNAENSSELGSTVSASSSIEPSEKSSCSGRSGSGRKRLGREEAGGSGLGGRKREEVAWAGGSGLGGVAVGGAAMGGAAVGGAAAGGVAWAERQRAERAGCGRSESRANAWCRRRWGGGSVSGSPACPSASHVPSAACLPDVGSGGSWQSEQARRASRGGGERRRPQRVG